MFEAESWFVDLLKTPIVFEHLPQGEEAAESLALEIKVTLLNSTVITS